MRHVTTRAAGLIILIAGIWGGLIPFVGPYFHFTLGPDKTWTWTSGRFWLSVLPAIVAVIGALMLLGAGPRATGRLGALLALAAGIWFVIGPDVGRWVHSLTLGAEHGGNFRVMLERLTFHSALGALITALAAYSLPGFLVRREVVADAAAAGAGAAAGAAGRRRRLGRRRATAPAAGRPVAGEGPVAGEHPVAGEGRAGGDRPLT